MPCEIPALTVIKYCNGCVHCCHRMTDITRTADDTSRIDVQVGLQLTPH